jgi:hypothetical protein
MTMKSTTKLLVAVALVLVTFGQDTSALAGEMGESRGWSSEAPFKSGTSMQAEERVEVTSASIRRFKLKVDSTDATSVRLKWRPVENATEYEVIRDGVAIGSTIATVGYFTDFGLRPGKHYRYTVTALNASGNVIGRSEPVSGRTRRSTTIRTHYTVLAIAFNPDQVNLTTDEIYLKHRIQFIQLASLGSAIIEPYQGRIISSAVTPKTEPGSSWADYRDLVTRRDIPELNGLAIVDLVERGDIDHVWVVKAPIDFWENILIGNRPIQGNGMTSANTWIPLAVKSSRSFFVNAYGPDERSYDAYAHMVEGVMTSISDGHPELWPRDLPYTVYTHDQSSWETVPVLLNQWEQFRLADGWNGGGTVAYASQGNGNLGSSHFPPTTPRDGGCSDYCYFDTATWQRYIDSAADDWLNFPVFNSNKRKINGYDFGAFNHYAQGVQSYSAAFGSASELHNSFRFSSASYHQWWFAHLPRNPGIKDGRLNTWWPHIFDFNRFDGSRIDYPVDGFHKLPTRFHPTQGEYGTDARSAEHWGYWHSQNGFSTGGKAAELSIVRRGQNTKDVKTGKRALKVVVENTQDWEHVGVGRNDVFYPISRNAHWDLSNLVQVQFSIKPGDNAELLAGTNPIVRLYKNGGNRIEFVPLAEGLYTNLFQNPELRDAQGWYTFTIPLAGNATWEKNVIGPIDVTLPASEWPSAKAQLEQDILADINYVEISIRSTTSQSDAPYDVVTYFIDGLELLKR